MSISTTTKALKGLVSFWELQSTGASVAKDAQGEAHNGVLEKSFTLVTGPLPSLKAIEFAGENGAYVKIAADPAFETPNLSIGLWVKFTTIQAEAGVFTTGLYDGAHIASPTIEVGASAANKKVQWGNFNNFQSGAWTVATANELEAGKWYFLAGTYDGSFWRLYVNGEEAASGPKATAGTLAYSKQHLGIGQYHFPTASNYLNGTVAFAFFSNAVVTKEELVTVYESGIPAVPIVVSGGPSALSGTAVTLNGTINPHNFNVTRAEVLYGTVAKTLTSKVNLLPLPGSGNSPIPVSGKLTGLSAGTRYFYKFEAESAEGVATSSETSVRTQPASANAYKEAVEAAGVNLVAYWRLNEAVGATEALDYGTHGKGVAKQGVFGTYETAGAVGKGKLTLENGRFVSNTGSNSVFFSQGGTGALAGSAVVTLSKPGGENFLREPTTEMTFECWFELKGAVNHACVFIDVSFDPGSGTLEPYPGIPPLRCWGYSFVIEGSGKLSIDYLNNSWTSALTNETVEAFRPYHFLTTFVAGAQKVYLNGRLLTLTVLKEPASVGYELAEHAEVSEQTGNPARLAHNGGEVEGETTPPNSTKYWYRDSTSQVLSEVSIVKKALTQLQAEEHWELGGAPMITSITPSTGPPGTFVKVKGQHFIPNTTVEMGGKLANGVNIISETELTCSATSALGAQPVFATSANGVSRESQTFTVTAETTVSGGPPSLGGHKAHIRVGV